MNFIDENFGSAFLILDFASKELTHKSLKNKIATIKPVIKALETQLKEYEQTEKYREGIYKDYIKSNKLS